MYLYHKTIVPGYNADRVATGRFLGSNICQLVVLSGTTLSIYNITDGKCYHIRTCDIFGIGRCIRTLHLEGYYKDLLVISSDSGVLCILEYNTSINNFIRVQEYKYGETGCLRDVPGQYLCVSPDNSFIAIGAIMLSLVVFPVKYSVGSNGTTISFTSVENMIYKSSNIYVYDMVWMDSHSLALLENNVTQLSKKISLYSVDNNEITLQINKFDLSKSSDLEISSLLSYNSNIVLCCAGMLTFIDFRVNRKETVMFAPSTAKLLITASASDSKAVYFGDDGGNLFSVSREGRIATKIASPLPQGMISLNLIVDTTHLYVFTETGWNFSLPLNRIGDPLLLSKYLVSIYYSIPMCINVYPVGSSAITQFVAVTGRGTSSAAVGITCGVCCATKNVYSMDNAELTRIISLTSLQNADRNDLGLMSSKDRTFTFTFSPEKRLVLFDSKFEKNEATLDSGVFAGMYAQVTTTHVILCDRKTRFAQWDAQTGTTISACCIGKRFVIIVINRDEVICLGVDRSSSAEGSPVRIMEMEKHVMVTEVNCVMEYGEYVVVALRDRSIRSFAVIGNQLEEHGIVALNSVPRGLYSFAMIDNKSFDPYISSSDSTIFVAGEDGILYFISFGISNDENDKVKMDVIYAKTISSSVLHFTPTILNDIPAVLVSSSNVYTVIFRNDIFSVIKLFTSYHDVKDFQQPLVRSADLSNFFTYRIDNMIFYYAWFKGNIIRLKFRCTNSSIFLDYHNLPVTSHVLTPTTTSDMIIRGWDVVNGKRRGNGVIISLNNEGMINEVADGRWDNGEITTAACVFNHADKDSSASEYAVICGINEVNGFFISYQARNNGKNDKSPRILWKERIDNKCFAVKYLTNNCIITAVGFYLRVYRLFETNMCLVSQIKCTDSFVTSLHVDGRRVYTTDNSGIISIFVLTDNNQISVILRHETHRSILRSCVLDDITVVVSDKFGDISVYRSMYSINEGIGQISADSNYRTQSGCSMTLIASTYVGAIVTSLFKYASASNSKQILYYSTINGAIGVLSPIESLDKLETIVALESIIMNNDISLVGRVVDDFRSTFVPCLSVVDGNICKKFFEYGVQQQTEIAKTMNMTITDIKRILIEINDI